MKILQKHILHIIFKYFDLGDFQKYLCICKKHIECVKEQMGMEKFNRFKDVFEVFYLSYEMGMEYQEKPAMERVGQIREAMEKVIHLSKTMGIATYQAADKMAEERLLSASPH